MTKKDNLKVNLDQFEPDIEDDESRSYRIQYGVNCKSRLHKYSTIMLETIVFL